MKECTLCKLNFPETNEYFYSAYNKAGTLSSWCKECQKSKSRERYKNNKEESNRRGKAHYRKNKATYNKMNRAWNRKNSEKLSVIAKAWRKNNKDKVKEYNQKYSNKKHNITTKEWNYCKVYFDNSCAYCGMTEIEHKEKSKQQLHKEHVIHEGRNDIKNCVPSCKMCNSSKRKTTLNEWYNPTNPAYSRDRYLRIYNWIRYDSKNININKL